LVTGKPVLFGEEFWMVFDW